MPTSLRVKEKLAPLDSTGLSHIPVLEPCEPEVVVCVDVSRFVQVTSVPTATMSSSRTKFSTSEATFAMGGEAATTGAGASGVAADAVGCGAGTDVAGGAGCVVAGAWGAGAGAGVGSEPQATAARAINVAAASPIRDFRRRLTLGLLQDRSAR